MRAANPRYKPLNTSKWYSNDIHRLDMVHVIISCRILMRCYAPAVSIATWYTPAYGHKTTLHLEDVLVDLQ